MSIGDPVFTLGSAGDNFKICSSFLIGLILKLESPDRIILINSSGFNLFFPNFSAGYPALSISEAVKLANRGMKMRYGIDEDFGPENFSVGFPTEDSRIPGGTHFKAFFIKEIDNQRSNEIKKICSANHINVVIAGFNFTFGKIFLFSGENKAMAHFHFRALLEYCRERKREADRHRHRLVRLLFP